MQKITLITGSTLGSAEYLADAVEQQLTQQGYAVALFNQATLEDILDSECLLVVTSTHGAGELPENIQPLFDDLASQQPDFTNMTFGVIGLGSSDYDTFCGAVNLVEEALAARGARKRCDSLRIDVVESWDHDSLAEAWLPGFLAS
ncbi:FMN-binding protein MioC [Pasteurellaceae bacterium Macca]|nr:FMN-binding protein MioC [Pasteurellaceae bacterium Macca]